MLQCAHSSTCVRRVCRYRTTYLYVHRMHRAQWPGTAGRQACVASGPTYIRIVRVTTVAMSPTPSSHMRPPPAPPTYVRSMPKVCGRCRDAFGISQNHLYGWRFAGGLKEKFFGHSRIYCRRRRPRSCRRGPRLCEIPEFGQGIACPRVRTAYQRLKSFPKACSWASPAAVVVPPPALHPFA